MNRTTKTFLSAAALIAAAAAAAPAANAAPQFQTGKFRAELEGVQKTTWQTNHVKQFACDVNMTGSGRETVRFDAKPAVVTISRFGNSTPIVMIERKQPTLLDRDVDRSRMIGQRLPVRELFDHGKHIVIAKGREVERTAESSSTTTIRWTLSLTRVVR
jgi:hypothetical protein